jgi:2-succinyl-6-hydroxy-2,4-cyclohexadiene-1-carboxylate synthase
MAELPTLVLLHGMLGSPAMWQPMIAALPSGARATSVTLPFHGLAPWGESIASFDEAVDALASQLPQGPLVLAGYSLGGRLALGLACVRSDVRAVVAIGAHLGIADEPARAQRRAWEGEMAALVRSRGMEALVEAWEALPLFASQRELARATFALQRATRLAHRPDLVARAFEVLGSGAMPSLEPRLLGSQCEILLVAGSLDERYRVANEVAAASLGCHRVVVAGAGHNVALEAPATLARLVAPYLDLAPRAAHQDVTSDRGEQAS